MNKAQLIDALAQRLGDKRTAGAAVDGLVDVIVRTVQKGEKVNITGFGVFEKRARAARTARNPRTGETVRVRKTNVPAFRAGTMFKDVVSGTKKLPRVAGTTRSTASKAAAGSSPAVRTAAKAGDVAKTAASKTTAAIKSAVPKSTKSTSAAKTTSAASTTTRKK